MGIDTIIATPHKRTNLFEFKADKIRENFNLLNNLIVESNLDVRIYLGCEYYFGPDLFEDINNGSVYTLGNSKYILVEFPTFKFGNSDKESLFRVFTSGYKIIVAHIERHRYSLESFYTLEYLRDNSALFQCDIMSLGGLWGEQTRLFMEDLLKKGFVDIISTDTHCKEFEEELLRISFDRLKEIYGGDVRERFMGETIKKRLSLL
jgi:protein-tyrosine phosphatase